MKLKMDAIGSYVIDVGGVTAVYKAVTRHQDGWEDVPDSWFFGLFPYTRQERPYRDFYVLGVTVGGHHHDLEYRTAEARDIDYDKLIAAISRTHPDNETQP